MSSAMKKLLISVSNIVTNFRFRNKTVKVFGYNNIYNFVHTTSVSRPSSSKCFSCEVPWIAPVIAKAALYWKDSIFWQKVALLGWSYKVSPGSRCGLVITL